MREGEKKKRGKVRGGEIPEAHSSVLQSCTSTVDPTQGLPPTSSGIEYLQERMRG